MTNRAPATLSKAIVSTFFLKQKSAASRKRATLAVFRPAAFKETVNEALRSDCPSRI